MNIYIYKKYIGIGWDDRNVAFNFFNAIDKFERHINMETDADLPKDLPMADFSLKEGEKVSIGLVETQKEQPKKKYIIYIYIYIYMYIEWVGV